MKKLLRLLLGRGLVIGLLIIFQLCLLIGLFYAFSSVFQIMYTLSVLTSWLLVIYIINKEDNQVFKLPWIIILIAIPLFGVVVYLMFGERKVSYKLRKQALTAEQLERPVFVTLNSEQYPTKDRQVNNQFDYLWKAADYPTYLNTAVKYFKLGEYSWLAILDDLRVAEKYIFMEFFIIEEGVMWDSILQILRAKAKAGLEIRILFDDAGCLVTLPNNFIKTMQSYGINAKAFNRMRPLLAIQMNNRDHRKIVVVDGCIGYTGGINLADEYINVTTPFGHWKDAMIRIEGEAVDSLVVMFLQMFNLGIDRSEHQKFLVDDHKTFSKDLVCPFGDSPSDNEPVGMNVHLNMIMSANRYFYAMTPYLVIDHSISSALILAAKRGVDVVLIVPRIPDKWYVFEVTKANYSHLVLNGVRVYEYEPGFIHSKVMISDDNIALVGTINMDFRSYFMHFECGVLVTGATALVEIRSDFFETMAVSSCVTKHEVLNVSFFKRIIRSIINVFAPLL